MKANSTFADDAPPSDTDSYYSSDTEHLGHGQPTGQYLRLKFPPFTLSKQIFFWSERRYVASMINIVSDRLENIQVLLNRPATPEETEAVVSQSSFLQNTTNYGGLLGLGVGTLVLNKRNADTVAKAGEVAAQQSGHNGPPVNFSNKELRRLFVRGAFILPVFLIIGNALGAAFGDVYNRVSMASDPRFAQLVNQIKHEDRAVLEARLKKYYAHKAAVRHAGKVPPTGVPQRSEDNTTEGADDNSPTGGYAPSEAYGPSPNQKQQVIADSKILRETYQSHRGPSDYSFSYSSPDNYQGDSRRQQQSPVASASSHSGAGAKGFWDDDDASPVNSEFAPTTAGSSEVASSGSSWARIRQQSMGSSPTNNDSDSNSSFPKY